MNFAQCLAKPKTNVTMMATVIGMGNERESNGKWSRQCELIDEMNVQYRVKIFRGSGMTLDETQVRQKLTFNLQAYKSNFDQKTYFSGFWNNREDGATPMNPPPQTAQSPPQAVSTPNAPQGQQATPNSFQDHAPAGYDGTIQEEKHLPAPQAPGKDEKAEGMVRHGVICAYIATGKEPIIEQVDYWVQYIMTGHAPVPPAKQIEDIPAPLESEIPDPDPSIVEGSPDFQG